MGAGMKGQLSIDMMYAFIVLDDDGTEGVVALMTDNGYMPMMGADMAMVDKLRPSVQQAANDLGKDVSLVVFTSRSVVDRIVPANDLNGSRT